MMEMAPELTRVEVAVAREPVALLGGARILLAGLDAVESGFDLVLEQLHGLTLDGSLVFQGGAVGHAPVVQGVPQDPAAAFVPRWTLRRSIETE